VREVKEELDLGLRNHELFKIVTEKARGQIIERIIYWCKISEKIENLKLREGAALKYFPSNEIPSLKIAFDLKPIIQELMETLIDNPKCA
jgi:ADP-ribose pyrophosphatase YjhB (NUDIX family)